MLIIIHYKCSAGMVMCLLPLVREGKNASLVGPGSWLLGRVTVTPPRAQLRIRAGRGRLRSASPASQFTVGKDAGRS